MKNTKDALINDDKKQGRAYYCAFCGTRLFSADSVAARQVLYRSPEYTLACAVLKDDADLSHLTHRNEEFLNEVWSCCRISVLRREQAAGAGSRIAYLDTTIEADAPPTPEMLRPRYEARHLTESTFEEMLAESRLPENANKLYAVKFTALWCPPCRVMDNVFGRILAAADMPDLVLCEVDSDEEQDLTDRFLCPSVPYILFFKQGNKLDISRFHLGAVNGGLSEAVSEPAFRGLCNKLAGWK